MIRRRTHRRGSGGRLRGPPDLLPVALLLVVLLASCEGRSPQPASEDVIRLDAVPPSRVRSERALEALQSRDARVADLLISRSVGAARFGRWKLRPDYRHPDVFLERIPSAVTRDYVRRVREGAALFAMLYGPGEGPSDQEGGPTPPRE